MKLLSHLALWCGLLIGHNACSQTVTLEYQDVLLNEILLDLNDRYRAQVSISSKLSSRCTITIHKQVASLDKAMELLAETCELEVHKFGKVYTFRKKKKKKTPEKTRKRVKPKKRFLFQGEILDKHTFEPLPYAKVRIENNTIKSDQKGRFSYRSLFSVEQLTIKHLGYVIADTTISNGNKHILFLSAEIQEMDEIEVFETKQNKTYSINSGEELGRIQLNNVGSTFIAGSNNNIVFNNLRMYPGIMAAGESNSDYVVWGSGPGQGQITYDGITLFNSTGMNGDLGRVNPLMIQDITVFKGGYNVHVGDRIGSVIQIESKDGDRNLASAVNIDNQMSSFYLSLPLLKKRASIQFAARKSYYQLFNLQERFFAKEENFIYPSYDYADLNFKFTAVLSNRDRVQISSIASLNGYSETFDKEEPYLYRSRLTAESFQIGSSLNYAHTWPKQGVTKLLISQSIFRPTESFLSTSTGELDLVKNYTTSIENGIDENQFRLSHTFPANAVNQFDISLAIINNNCHFVSRIDAITEKENRSNLNRLSFFLRDQVTLWKKLHVQLGVKSDLLMEETELFIQPRVNGHIDVGNRWNVNFGWGIYNQFVSKIQLIDSKGIQSLIWSLSDDTSTPVQQSIHHVIGGSYLSDRVELGIEGYYKTYSGISRFIQNEHGFDQQLMNGFGYGLDVLSKLRFQKHHIMVSYSLGQFFEYADYEGSIVELEESEQSQRHEIKTSINLDFSPVEISIVGVYGSGISIQKTKDDELSFPYSRVDFSLKYSKKLKKISLSTGVSILNLFNTLNPRLFRATNFSDSSSYRTLGIPFTPTLFFSTSI